MAFGTKYRTTFFDILLQEIQIDIQIDGYGGSVTDLESSGAELSWSGSSLLDTFRTSSLSLSVYASSNLQFSEFFTVKQKEIKGLVYIDSTLYWTGWMLSRH